jgi:hypothetical protein
MANKKYLVISNQIPIYHDNLIFFCSFHTEKISQVLDCGDKVGAWLDNLLDKPGFRLYYHHLEKTQREAQSPLQKRFDVPASAKVSSYANLDSYIEQTRNTHAYHSINSIQANCTL